jgi:hypothetical protein
MVSQTVVCIPVLVCQPFFIGTWPEKNQNVKEDKNFKNNKT